MGGRKGVKFGFQVLNHWKDTGTISHDGEELENGLERVKIRGSFLSLFCLKCLVGIEEEVLNRQLSLKLRDFKARDDSSLKHGIPGDHNGKNYK